VASTAVDESFAPLSRIGPAAAVAPIFDERCAKMRVLGDPDRPQRPGEREENLEYETPATSISMRWECEDAKTGAQVIAHLYLEPGVPESTQVEALSVTFGGAVRFGDAIEVAADYLAPLLTVKQREAMAAMTRRFVNDDKVRGFRIDAIGVTMGGVGVEVLPYTDSYRWRMLDDWDDFER
jgi:hypothetical protein